MAEETTQSAMDYAEHERTYAGFIALTKIGTVYVITILLALAIFGFGGSWSFSVGILVLVLATIAAAIGMASNGSVVAPTVALVLSLGLFVLTVAS